MSCKSAPISAVIDCQKYRLSEHLQSDPTCRHTHGKVDTQTAQKNHSNLYWQDVSLILNGPATGFEGQQAVKPVFLMLTSHG